MGGWLLRCLGTGVVWVGGRVTLRSVEFVVGAVCVGAVCVGDVLVLSLCCLCLCVCVRCVWVLGGCECCCYLYLVCISGGCADRRSCIATVSGRLRPIVAAVAMAVRFSLRPPVTATEDTLHCTYTQRIKLPFSPSMPPISLVYICLHARTQLFICACSFHIFTCATRTGTTHTP